MNKIYSVIPKFIPKQINIPYVGAVYDLTMRVVSTISVLNMIFMSRVYYYNTGDSYLRDVFPSYWIFVCFLAFLCVLAALWMWAFVIPSHNKFCQTQSIIENRSPTFDKVCEISKQIEALQKEIDSIKN